APKMPILFGTITASRFSHWQGASVDGPLARLTTSCWQSADTCNSPPAFAGYGWSVVNVQVVVAPGAISPPCEIEPKPLPPGALIAPCGPETLVIWMLFAVKKRRQWMVWSPVFWTVSV